MSYPVLLAFISTFFFVSITPGMCMTLALTLGMSVGFKKTLWMMIGELFGVALVAIFAIVGVAAVMLKYPDIFSLLKYGGGLYLAYIGINMWLSKGNMAIKLDGNDTPAPKRSTLISQGFITAISNPKGWAFFVALLPPFVNMEKALAPQMLVLLLIILSLEFICMCLYSMGGRTLRRFLQKAGNVQILNRIAGTMMIGVAIWLATG